MKKATKFLTTIGLSFLFLISVCFAGNPLLDLFGNITEKSPADFFGNANAEKNPFLQEFLIVYQGDWVFISSTVGPYYSIDIFKEPSSCNDDGTECCGVLEARHFDGNSTEIVVECLFCLTSTYEIHLKDFERTWDIQCIGVHGGKMENPLHEDIGYAIDDPTIIECQTFRLVRPE